MNYQDGLLNKVIGQHRYVAFVVVSKKPQLSFRHLGCLPYLAAANCAEVPGRNLFIYSIMFINIFEN